MRIVQQLRSVGDPVPGRLAQRAAVVRQMFVDLDQVAKPKPRLGLTHTDLADNGAPLFERCHDRARARCFDVKRFL